MEAKFVKVIFPLAIPKLYTYIVPKEMVADIQIGCRVEVSLKNKLYASIIAEIHDDVKLEHTPKPIISILDKSPLVTIQQIQFWSWVADYYCCTVGEVMNVALPSSLKLESETKVILNGDLYESTPYLSDDEYLVAEAISIQNELTIIQIQQILQKKTIFPILRNMIDKKIILIKEELIEKFKPKKVNYAVLDEEYQHHPDKLVEAFDAIAKSELQTKALLAFVQLSKNKKFSLPVSEVCQLAGVDTSVIRALEKKKIFSIHQQIQSRINKDDTEESALEWLQPLSEAQNQALIAIQSFFKMDKAVLLHGITGSGKTRVYIELIKECLDKGQQVLYLLPEIALTNHMVDRLKATFSNQVLVYHSKMNQQERAELWNEVLLGSKVVVAARSGVFLPFTSLGLIIVDEEHDPSFKQQEPNPRYNARDAAIYLSKQMFCKIILGSATPSLESYENTQNHKYGLVELSDRYGEAILPKIKIVDLKDSFKDQRFKGIFSVELITAIEDALAEKTQVLLFQNRRGYAPTLNCMICGWKAQCINCDVHMTKHKSNQEMKCHYCGSRNKVPVECPACGSTDLFEQGFGTEKIEEEITSLFPTAVTARLDLDTAKTKLAFEAIMHQFEKRKIDILVGTQMISKGLDFDNISLVGILNADAILRYPDLRANERAFQLMTQVAGRAGRRQKQGLVMIQTFSPQHPVIIETLHHQYQMFFLREAMERKRYLYPPFFRMIQISVFHKNQAISSQAASHFTSEIRKKIGNRIIGPAPAVIPRIRNLYIFQMTIKMEKDPSAVSKVKHFILEQKEALKSMPFFKTVRINIDVDPY